MRSRLALPILVALLALAFLASLAFGELRLGFGQVVSALMGGGDDIARTVVRDFRLPRALVGMAAGAALGASGVVMQAFFRNPLASPGLLGVSSGGALGAVAVLASRWEAERTPVFEEMLRSARVAPRLAPRLAVLYALLTGRSEIVVELGKDALDALLPVEPLRYGRTIWGYDGWTLAMPVALRRASPRGRRGPKS